MAGGVKDFRRTSTVGAIGEEVDTRDQEVQDTIDAESFYSQLEREIVRVYYDCDRNHVPHSWVERMKASICTIAPVFNSDRMGVRLRSKALSFMSSPWQLDFYRRPLKKTEDDTLWELLVCTPEMDFSYAEICPQPQADAMWLRQQLKQAIHRAGYRPSVLEVFRPQAQTLTEVACRELDIPGRAETGIAYFKTMVAAASGLVSQSENLHRGILFAVCH